MSYKHFTLDERKYLQQLLAEGLSMRKIAQSLGRSPSSVSREIKRNRSKANKHKDKNNNKYCYHPWRAQTLYICRKRYSACRRAIEEGSELWQFVIDKLQLYWSPEQISAKWRINHPESKIGVSTIYRYLAAGLLPGVSRKNNLRRRAKKRQTRNALYNTIHPDRLVTDRPAEIEQQARIGDWEGDTVYGGVGKGLLVTLVDRKTRYLVAGLLDKRNATHTRTVISKLMKDLPVCSLTFDNGSEFSEFRELEQDLKTSVYFAEPHKPWQRGSNENTNDILRFFFPKGFDFRSITQEDVDEVVRLINGRPRKCLNWQSATEAFNECCT